MKTEAEIRLYRDQLQKAADAPCRCAGTEHESKCRAAGMAMAAELRALCWVLGEGDERYEAWVQRLTSHARN